MMMKKVLVVEDDADAREIYARILEERGYTVITATNGAEGVHFARRTHPDLILMDLRMPVMDGWQAVRYVRADSTTSKIPVWALSAYLDEQPEGYRPARSFDRFIPKPCPPEQLAADVERWLGPAGTGRSPSTS